MRRFAFALIALAFAADATSAVAQTAGKTYRLGVVVMRSGGPGAIALREELSRTLAERGFSLDRNLAIETRSPEGNPERLPRLLKELEQSRVDAIVTSGYPAARAAKDATTTIPIVVINAGDPVATGLAASFNRPGGNLTGISDLSAELSTKRLELLKAAVPDLKRVAMLWHAGDFGMDMRYQVAAATATTLGIAVQPLGVREPDDFDAAFAAMTRDKPDGIMLVTDALTLLNRKRVFEFASANHLPAMYEFDSLARDGGLMSYGPDGTEVISRVADLVARVLKGTKPADLPFEQPTRFRFVINKKTADALGLALPSAVLERADEVIE